MATPVWSLTNEQLCCCTQRWLPRQTAASARFRDQELADWAADRLSRIEAVAEHTLEVAQQCCELLSQELADIRDARDQLSL